MSKRDLISQELGRLSEPDLDRLLAFLRTLAEDHAEAMVPAMAAETALAKTGCRRGGRSLGQFVKGDILVSVAKLDETRERLIQILSEN